MRAGAGGWVEGRGVGADTLGYILDILYIGTGRRGNLDFFLNQKYCIALKESPVGNSPWSSWRLTAGR